MKVLACVWHQNAVFKWQMTASSYINITPRINGYRTAESAGRAMLRAAKKLGLEVDWCAGAWRLPEPRTRKAKVMLK